ncbi:hypothetical protein B0T14DRAFT_200090 [Immersiella caudata]|uniref:Uncharacterized protein n=1 Tax=Immersiella caudata TaxID=314043 RepID=A0AA39WP93_9PEZI|nr:hypothetical protein B0T14DRAFT_200090 [Immersiella caudata]
MMETDDTSFSAAALSGRRVLTPGISLRSPSAIHASMPSRGRYPEQSHSPQKINMVLGPAGSSTTIVADCRSSILDRPTIRLPPCSAKGPSGSAPSAQIQETAPHHRGLSSSFDTSSGTGLSLPKRS